jgi:aspartyl aminopeptidase
MLSNILERIVLTQGGDREDFFRALSKSFIIHQIQLMLFIQIRRKE